MGFSNNGYCVRCNRAYGRANYQANKARYFAQAKLRDVALDDLINSYKAQPCADCEVQYPPYVMDLDHRDPTLKITKVSTLRRSRAAFIRITEEMEKCDVVCANCHRERTSGPQGLNPARYAKVAV